MVDKKAQEIKLSQIVPSKLNPRKSTDAEQMKQLTESIKAQGVLQPIIVRLMTESAMGNKTFEIVCGERRYMAAKAAGHETIPAIVMDLTDDQAAEIAIIENLQREDVNAIQEAAGYDAIITKTGCTIADVSLKVGKPAKYITDRIRLLALNPEIRAGIEKGDISPAHGIVLTRIGDPKERVEFFKAMLKNKWSVRQAENELEQCGRCLSNAPFDAADCKKCPSNGAKQKDLFDTDTDLNGKCLDSGCYDKKCTDHLLARVEAIKKAGGKVETEARIEKMGKSGGTDLGQYKAELGAKLYADRCTACPDHVFVIESDRYGDGPNRLIERCLKPKCLNALIRSNKPKTKESQDGDRDSGLAESRKSNRIREAKTAFWTASLLKDQNQQVIYAVVAHLVLNSITADKASEIAKAAGIAEDKNEYRPWSVSRLFGLEKQKLMKVITQAAAVHIEWQMPYGDADQLQALAEATGHQIAKEWKMTEAYLQATSKDELQTLAKELGITKGLPETKADRMAHILKYAPKGKVPKELVK